MTTEWYKVFNQVAESGSISKAAQALYVSQPAVSKSIMNLEENLGITLFVRTSKGVTLTKEGELLYKHVERAFKQLDEGEKIVRQLKNNSFGAIRIGISNTLCKYYFIPHLKAFHQVYPKLKIEIVNRTSPDTVNLLEKNLLDCAIISDVQMEEGFVYYKLIEIQDTFVSSRKPPEEIIKLKELESYPMLLLEPKNATRDHLEMFLAIHKIQLNVEIEISSMEFLVEFAKIDLGVASVIREFVQEEIDKKQLYEWKTKPSLPPRNIGLLYQKDATLSIACKTFIDFMKKRNE